MTGSLRSGPLSPAMLAGPQSTFDVSNFRSGFTPDLSSFKTGLTPLGSSSSGFPPPSPNTAAFLAMVTNSSAPGITPNTLSALSGNPMDAHANGQSLIASHPGNNGKSHHHGEHHDQFDFAFGRSMQDTPSKQGSKLRMSTMGNEGRDGSADFADSKAAHQERGGPNQRQQQQTTQAASGLFLLSQAHQELSKREDAAAAAAAITHPTYTGQQLYSSGNGPKSADGKAAKGPNNKRKKSTEPGAIQKPASAKKVKSAGPGKMDDFTMEDMGYESDEIDDDGNRKTKSSNGEGGDDEDKRKSFLERNRQAALKCRQRKKAWLASLQAKVEYLQSDNDNLQGTCSALRNEVMFLKSQLMQAQRQLGVEGGGNAAQAPSMGRNSISGPEQNNTMTAAGANRIGATSGQYQAHAVPRPTHIPGQPNAQQYPSHPLQGSAQAA
jgi:ATF/CREB family transcription factor